MITFTTDDNPLPPAGSHGVILPIRIENKKALAALGTGGGPILMLWQRTPVCPSIVSNASWPS